MEECTLAGPPWSKTQKSMLMLLACPWSYPMESPQTHFTMLLRRLHQTEYKWWPPPQHSLLLALSLCPHSLLLHPGHILNYLHTSLYLRLRFQGSAGWHYLFPWLPRITGLWSWKGLEREFTSRRRTKWLGVALYPSRLWQRSLTQCDTLSQWAQTLQHPLCAASGSLHQLTEADAPDKFICYPEPCRLSWGKSQFYHLLLM